MAISESTSRRLLADSGGICANPACGRELFRPLPDGRVATVYERAHIIARERDGPRGKEPLSDDHRDAYENLVLLCVECHKTVDDHAHVYPVSLIQKWKEEHRDAVRAGVTVPQVPQREQLNEAVAVVLRENRAIHREYGPAPGGDPSAFDRARMWRQKVIETIIPNNRKILALLRRNQRLLNAEDQELFNAFQIHAEGLAFNHLSGQKNAAVPVFPLKFGELFERPMKPNA